MDDHDEFGFNETTKLDENKNGEGRNKVEDEHTANSVSAADSAVAVTTTATTKEKKSDLLQLPPDSAQMLKHKRVISDSSSIKSSGSGRSGKSGSGSSRTPKEKVDRGIMVGTDIQLPQRFVVKYLGFRETTNLWGIKHTRKPVDEMVADAKRMLSTSKGKTLPLLKLEVVEDGIIVGPMPQNTNKNFPAGKFAIQSISYGVQDLVYTRVFAMIVVKSEVAAAAKKTGTGAVAENGPTITAAVSDQNSSSSSSSSPFRCHAFVTDTRETAKNLTYALASAFQIFSQSVAAGKIQGQKPARFAIDLRPEAEMKAEIDDSEA